MPKNKLSKKCKSYICFFKSEILYMRKDRISKCHFKKIHFEYSIAVGC